MSKTHEIALLREKLKNAEATSEARFKRIQELEAQLARLGEPETNQTPVPRIVPAPETATKYAIGDKVRIVGLQYAKGVLYDTISGKTGHRYQLAADSQDDYSWKESELEPYTEDSEGEQS